MLSNKKITERTATTKNRWAQQGIEKCSNESRVVKGQDLSQARTGGKLKGVVGKREKPKRKIAPENTRRGKERRCESQVVSKLQEVCLIDG